MYYIRVYTTYTCIYTSMYYSIDKYVLHLRLLNAWQFMNKHKNFAFMVHIFTNLYLHYMHW